MKTAKTTTEPPDRQPPACTMRPVRPDDNAFLCGVYASTREQELGQVPWSPEMREAFIMFQFEAQQRHYQADYPDAEHSIILVDGRPAGRLYVDRRPNEIRIMDITLLPAWRGTGVGSGVIRDLMDEAGEARKRLTIYVENFNPSQRLFERMGFSLIERDGFLHLYEWKPPASTR